MATNGALTARGSSRALVHREYRLNPGLKAFPKRVAFTQASGGSNCHASAGDYEYVAIEQSYPSVSSYKGCLDPVKCSLDMLFQEMKY
jgi:hypothetical protein